MDSSTLFSTLFLFSFLTFIMAPIAVSGGNSNLFVEYIGAEDKNVKFSDVPINSGVEFHFILSFAIDYTNNPTSTPTPRNGTFDVFWDKDNLSPDAVSAIKQNYPNVKVAVSLGGDSVHGEDNKVTFTAPSVEIWVSNAVSSLTTIIQQYNLDGIDIDYEHFSDGINTETFTECIGQLITTLKDNGVISFASIAPFHDQGYPVRQAMYKALWAKYSSVIDYVNYQFYGYGADTTVDQYVQYYDEQVSNYTGGNILASFITESTTTSGAFSADTGLNACKELKSESKLYGIFIWSADDSRVQGFTYENQSQELLVGDGDTLNLVRNMK